MKVLKTLFALTLIAVHATAAAQSSDATEGEMFSYSPTPQTRAFIRYGNNTVNRNTGTLSVNIPIYTYKDNDFELPLSATYCTQGFIPGQQSGILGLGWFLNCGGTVSRDIQGLPDDHTSENGTNGFLMGNNTYNEEQAMNITGGSLESESLRYYTIGGRETTSDIYHFNFNGHSGTFHFDGNRQLHIYNTGGNHGTYTITPIMPENDELCGFAIKTGDGYEFTFGSTEIEERISSTERSIGGSLTGSSIFTFSKQGLTENPIVTWNLTKIKAPNGRTVTFSYEQVPSNIGTCISPASDNNPFLVTTFSPCLLAKDQTGTQHMRNVGVVQTTYLSGITVDNGTEIELSMSLKNCSDRPSAPSVVNGIEQDHCITQNLKKLDAVAVTNSEGRIVHSTQFTYRVKDNRLMLVKVHTDGIGDYTMSYHEEETFPAISTPDVDFWGFYNGRGNEYYVVSATEADADYNDYISSDAKNPDWHYSRLGCLKRITYPTKGFSTFEYSPNHANEILLKRKHRNTTITPAAENGTANYSEENESEVAYLVDIYPYSILFGNNDETGGVRLSRTTDYDAYGGYRTRTFTYSGGIVNKFPKHNTAVLHGVQIYNPLLEYPCNSLDKQHICYSTVRETNADGSYTVYKYNDYHSDPDEYDGQSHKKMSDFGNIGYAYAPAFINNILRSANSRHAMRGKVKEILHCDSDGTPVKQTEYRYALHDSSYTAHVVMSGKYASSVKRYTGDCRPIEIREKEYFSGDSICTLQQLTYDSMGRICTNATTGPDNIRIKSHTEYCNDQVRNIYLLPVATSVIEEKEGIEVLTSATKYDYVLAGGTLRPYAVKKALLEAGTPYDGTQESDLTYIPLQRVVSYDTMGNPTEVIDRHGVHTAYLWGYGGMYPIVKAHGTTSAALASLLDITDCSPLHDTLSSSERDKLFNIPGVLVEIYEHEPLVGMTRHYDNNGNSLFYEYDIYGRLTVISDDEGKLKSYSYTPASGSLELTPVVPELKPIE